MTATPLPPVEFDDLFTAAYELVRRLNPHGVLSIQELLDLLKEQFTERFTVSKETYEILALVEYLWMEQHIHAVTDCGCIEFAWIGDEPRDETSTASLKAMLPAAAQASSGEEPKHAEAACEKHGVDE